MADAEQMIGRSSRSQGMQNGTVITYNENKLPVGQQITDLLAARDKVNVLDQGEQVLGAITKMWEKCTSQQQKILSGTFGTNNAWKTNVEKVKKLGLPRDI